MEQSQRFHHRNKGNGREDSAGTEAEGGKVNSQFCFIQFEVMKLSNFSDRIGDGSFSDTVIKERNLVLEEVYIL